MSSPNTPSVVSETRPLSQYQWGKDCLAFNLLNNKNLSVKLEKMPPETEEELHYHKQSQQFFYIIRGTAAFEVDEVILIVHEGEGLHIEAGKQHRVMNKEVQQTLEFLVCSQPATENDRYNLA